MEDEIKPNSVYTTNETRTFLKISESTIKRLLKKGMIKANKVGGQYRILGKEILRILSPKVERKTVDIYQKMKNKIKKRINRWGRL